MAAALQVFYDVELHACMHACMIDHDDVSGYLLNEGHILCCPLLLREVYGGLEVVHATGKHHHLLAPPM